MLDLVCINLECSGRTLNIIAGYATENGTFGLEA